MGWDAVNVDRLRSCLFLHLLFQHLQRKPLKPQQVLLVPSSGQTSGGEIHVFFGGAFRVWPFIWFEKRESFVVLRPDGS